MALSRKRVLAAKIESTPYTAESLANADCGFNVYDAKFAPAIERIERVAQGGFGHLADGIGTKMGTVTFKVDCHGDGSLGDPTAWADTFLTACGWVDNGSGLFEPKTEAPETNAGSGVNTLTIGGYEDGKKKAIKGAVGSWQLVWSAGKILQMEFTFMGAWVNPSMVSILSPTYPTVKPWRATTSGSFGGVSSCFESTTIQSGNDVQMRPCQNEASGFKGAIVAQRVPTFTMNPEEAGNITNDTAFASGTNSLALALQAINDDDNIFNIAASDCQIVDLQEGERAGLVTDDLTVKCLGETSLTLEFTQV